MPPGRRRYEMSPRNGIGRRERDFVGRRKLILLVDFRRKRKG